jgi:hypothetical protein
LNEENVEKLIKECHIYQDTVTFFSVIYEFGNNNSIPLQIEKEFQGMDGNNKTPDFALVQGSHIVDVLEHKGTLSASPQAAIDEVNEVVAKYSKLKKDDVVSSPNIAFLAPSCADEVVKKIRPEIPSNVTLCCYDQSSVDDEIGFSIIGRSSSRLVDDILSRTPIKFRPSLIRSTYKFIKASPPLIYTAYQLRSQFYIYRDIRSADEDEYRVSRRKLLSDAETFYPPWIRNNHQLNAGRVDDALRFLDQIGYVSWKSGDEILVYPSMGSRSGDQIEYLARKLAAARTKERKTREKSARLPITRHRGEQLTLSRFQ